MKFVNSFADENPDIKQPEGRERNIYMDKLVRDVLHPRSNSNQTKIQACLNKADSLNSYSDSQREFGE